MKIGITGAAGFLGLHIANKFDSNNFELSLFDISNFIKNT